MGWWGAGTWGFQVRGYQQPARSNDELHVFIVSQCEIHYLPLCQSEKGRLSTFRLSIVIKKKWRGWGGMTERDRVRERDVKKKHETFLPHAKPYSGLFNTWQSICSEVIEIVWVFGGKKIKWNVGNWLKLGRESSFIMLFSTRSWRDCFVECH